MRGHESEESGDYGPRSLAGARTWDAMETLLSTARKLGVNFFQYIRDRVSGVMKMPSLADLIQQRAETMRSRFFVEAHLTAQLLSRYCLCNPLVGLGAFALTHSSLPLAFQSKAVVRTRRQLNSGTNRGFWQGYLLEPYAFTRPPLPYMTRMLFKQRCLLTKSNVPNRPVTSTNGTPSAWVRRVNFCLI